MCSMSIGVSIRRRRVVHKVHTSVSTALEEGMSVIYTTGKHKTVGLKLHIQGGINKDNYFWLSKHGK